MSQSSDISVQTDNKCSQKLESPGKPSPSTLLSTVLFLFSALSLAFFFLHALHPPEFCVHTNELHIYSFSVFTIFASPTNFLIQMILTYSLLTSSCQSFRFTFDCLTFDQVWGKKMCLAQMIFSFYS